MSDAYSLLLAFDGDSPEFARGFTAGRVWELTRVMDDPVVLMIQANNAEMVLRIAEARGVCAQSIELGDGWLEITFSERRSS